MPAALQTLGTWTRHTAFLERARTFLERARKRDGPRFTIRVLGQSPFVMLTGGGERRPPR
jgi:hypothetical protein